MQLHFVGPLWYLRGPAPFHFVTVPESESELIAAASDLITYGWGMIPVAATIGGTGWSTSLWRKDGGYTVPVKAAARRAERLELGGAAGVNLIVHTWWPQQDV